MTKGNDAGVSNAVGGPAEGADEGVVKAFFQCCSAFYCVGFGDAGVEAGVGFILVVVVGGFLTNGVRRVTKDDSDGLAAEALESLAVVFKVLEKVLVRRAGFVHAEGIREADAFEGLVVFLLHDAVVGDFDVDARDVVGEQHDFAGVELLPVFAGEVFFADEAALDGAHDEGARAGEGVEDFDAFGAEAFVQAEFALEDVVHAADDKVDDFDGRIDDAEFFGETREGFGEEFFVEFDDDLLAPGGVVDAGGSLVDGFVEALEFLGFFRRDVAHDEVEHAVHGGGDGVLLREFVVVEEGVEDGGA